ncbi:hypothetical protein KKE19_00085 [Patescibacteria group bacterium]|nr:hypothetical protein [Patescibacteria group bacterium]MBU4274208.1 hypothetical protein [Patescibacteria group bacterium]MBU4367304.1 hypothetical protein [Patescibacteria group bacterium]MBU4461641.1 hypothetical protein [Patescibacteria group bacterium]MCG2699691.1 hypothetical protein [Candidatus Parcubacteria bacterium]
MPISSQIKDFIKKLQNLPLRQRKIILWAVVIILGIALVFLWWNFTKEKLKKIDLNDAVKQFIPSAEEGQNGE